MYKKKKARILIIMEIKLASTHQIQNTWGHFGGEVRKPEVNEKCMGQAHPAQE